MDFLKTLLAYMTLLTALSVQEGPLPETVPTPTPVPPSVTATAVPFQTEAPTATPGPTQAPVPVLTPNTRYETVQFADRGNAVKKLQNRLIELGYMPEGSADGAYGYQTYNAVRDFQKANGLEADGVAGPATLTNLYENPDIRPNTTATPAPTATPTPTLPPQPTPTATPDVTAEPDPVETIALPDTLPTDALASGNAAAEAKPGNLGLTKVENGFIIPGNTGVALGITQMMDGKTVTIRPGLWRNAAGDAVVSLPELVDCMEGWALMGSSADGHYYLNAAGYAIEILCTPTSVMVEVDGKPVNVTATDVQLLDSVLYITDDFLELTLKADTVFDEEEASLVFFITDKSMANAMD